MGKMRYILNILFLCTILVGGGCGGGSTGTGVDSSVVFKSQYVVSKNSPTNKNLSITILETGQTLVVGPNQSGSLEIPNLDSITYILTPPFGSSEGKGIRGLVFEDCGEERRIDEIRLEYVHVPERGAIEGYRVQDIVGGMSIGFESVFTCSAADCDAIFNDLIPEAPEYVSQCNE